MPTTKKRTALADPPGWGWSCKLPCPGTGGIRRDAPTEQAARAAWRRHYLTDHYRRPGGGR